ncbi:hypothetical protein [Mycobacterium sp. 96-892]|uniref:hypothetical protein n=1 Tax=Mycobacterium sp. 96-892 TaxID=1855664 RepID=UPI0011174260|nr:hypothetical protein [Mycobacterium sp. 96-892]
MARSAEARRIMRELERELESASQRANKKLSFTATERATLDLICANLDRISDLNEAYLEATEVKVRIKLSTEMRLLEASAARMLKGFKTDLPGAETQKTRSARRAADIRWQNAAG